jgi:hypothetical protein
MLLIGVPSLQSEGVKLRTISRLTAGILLILAALSLASSASRADGPTTVHIIQAIWPLPPKASEQEVDAALRQADALAGSVQGCDNFQRAVPEGSNFRDFGWVSIDDMPPEIRDLAVNQKIGVPSNGIRGDGGVAVFVICARRMTAAEAHLAAAIWPLPENPTAEDVRAAREQSAYVFRKVRSCADFQRAAAAAPAVQFSDFGWLHLDKMPAAMRVLAGNQAVGMPTLGFAYPSSIVIYVVCERR